MLGYHYFLTKKWSRVQGFLRQKISGQGLAFIVGGGSGMPSVFPLLLKECFWPFNPAYLVYVVIMLSIPSWTSQNENSEAYYLCSLHVRHLCVSLPLAYRHLGLWHCYCVYTCCVHLWFRTRVLMIHKLYTYAILWSFIVKSSFCNTLGFWLSTSDSKCTPLWDHPSLKNMIDSRIFYDSCIVNPANWIWL